MHSERQVIRLARKKIVFIIVEGPSDDTALGTLFHRMYDQNTTFVHIMHRDITAEHGVTPENILARLGNEVRAYARSNHFTNKDFQEIIHIVDLDGAYIPDSFISENVSVSKTVYSESGITARSAEKIAARNRQKRQNLNKLYTCPQLWKIPYRVFYMSCNLDHVLYNKLNSSDKEKENDASVFALQYRDHIDAFRAFIADSDFSISTDYKKSWEFIQTRTKSLKRHTNLGLCFPISHNPNPK